MSATSPSLTPGKSGDIKDSIAALRSILMIDTPTKSLLSGQHPSVAAQQSRYDERKVQWDELARLRDNASELKHRVQEATAEAANETRKRKTLETTYDALAKHKKELSVQLELVTKSREAAEEKIEQMRTTLNNERAAMAKERVEWKPEMDRLSREKNKFEREAKELRVRCQSAEQKVQELGNRVRHLEKELADTKTALETNLSSQASLQPRVDQSETARRKAEQTLAQVQAELDTIKHRHQKSLGSMLEIQQKLKKKLADAEQDKKAAEEKLQQVVSELRIAKEATQNLTDKIEKMGGGELQQNTSSKTETDEQIKTLTELLNEAEEARAVAEEEVSVGKLLVLGATTRNQNLTTTQLQSLRQQRQQPTSESHRGASTVVTAGNSIVVLDKLIQDAAEMPDDEINFDFVQQLAKVAHGVKAEMMGLQTTKQEAEAQLKAKIAADEGIRFELATSRESLREVSDQLLDSREEAEQLREALAALRQELQRKTGNKRSYGGHSDSEEDGDEENDSIGKRRRKDDHDGSVLI